MDVVTEWQHTFVYRLNEEKQPGFDLFTILNRAASLQPAQKGPIIPPEPSRQLSLGQPTCTMGRPQQSGELDSMHLRFEGVVNSAAEIGVRRRGLSHAWTSPLQVLRQVRLFAVAPLRLAGRAPGPPRPALGGWLDTGFLGFRLPGGHARVFHRGFRLGWGQGPVRKREVRRWPGNGRRLDAAN